MLVKEYDNARMFLDNCETILLEKEAVSQLLLYSAYQSLASSQNEKEVYGAILDNEETILLFANVPNHNLILYGVQQEKAAPATHTLADFMGNSHITIAGINAKLELCQSFIEQYKKYINCTFLQKYGTYIMEIRKVNDIKPTQGLQRLALPEESKLIVDWMIQFELEASISEMDYEEALKRTTNLIDEEKIYLFENSEKIVVSMAVVTRKLVHGIAITYVFTPEEFRGNGYAATNMYYLSKLLLEQGYEFCTLFVDKKNPLSNRAYEKVGYKILDDSYEYKVIQTEV